MPSIKRFALTVTLILSFSLLCRAQEQTPTVEMTADSNRAQFAARGEVQQVRVQVFSASGERVFDSGVVSGQSVAWEMRDKSGRRVEDGLYLVSIMVTDSAGVEHKRTEQISVSRETQAMVMPGANAPPPSQAIGPISGEGSAASPTSGRIARFTDTHEIGDSIMVESANRLIINPLGAAPNAVLQVNGLQPAPSAASGTTATALLTTTGGKGGNTTGTTGQSAGAGASISLVAGQGGDGPSGSFGSFPGKGGSITLQPGSGGAALGAGAKSGNVLLAPSGVGYVGIGTASPLSRLHVHTVSDNYGLLHSNGTVEVGTWAGSGSAGTQGGWFGTKTNHPLRFFAYNSGAAMTINTNGSVGIGTVMTIETGGRVGIGTATPQNAKLHVEGGSDTGVWARGTSTGVYGASSYSGGFGVYGFNSSGGGIGVYGYSHSGKGVEGSSLNGTGVSGTSSNGYAGYFTGKAKVTGALEVGSCTGCTISSDQNLKANFSSVNPRWVLDRMAALPIREWNYKSDSPSVRHVGPMAQDFRSAFNLGADDKHIDMIDANGVTMAAIQGLYQMMQEKDQETQEMMREKDRQIEQLQARLAQVERAVKQRRVRNGR